MRKTRANTTHDCFTDDQTLDRTSSELYQACSNNDIMKVKRYTEKLSIDDINRPEKNGNTALHIATLKGYTEIIKLLLKRNPCRSIKNIYNYRPYQLATTDEIRHLYKRANCFPRFTYKSGCLPLYQKENKSRKKFSIKHYLNQYSAGCSLCDNDDPCEWEIVDENAAEKAARFRKESKHSLFFGHNVGRDLKNRLYSIKKGYLDSRLRDMPLNDSIKYYFRKASDEQDPCYVIKAYTSACNFYSYVNGDMARNVIHDLKQGCSKFFCTRLYSAQDGVMSITSILLHHPYFEPYSFIGEVYRGMVVKKTSLAHYRCGIRIVNTTFLSTSKTEDVAEFFNELENDSHNEVSVFCTYKIKNNRTALDISGMSEIPDEQEVLILPFAAFEIMSIARDKCGRTEICLEECDPPEENDSSVELAAPLQYFTRHHFLPKEGLRKRTSF
ncbi:unnamed protein product [Didymodactylos carnosus]|uniref:NAD(P)(+)--arginine ADP-ribosyltransferase n=1 Tax=Didymodactylos carnosus TaxID=1234261 RepID=A0A813RBU2_9BILA|nr:unnamed protein product [Didymodactylos carnosus]CAF0923986.1 unnamed protein product [Didymodactylos carnosus]CAF3562222.1 unnamed protein product [Didymodactylos carnosus]CAF3701150.1 unnamed protein product [Didymodactylos carnosus]